MSRQKYILICVYLEVLVKTATAKELRSRAAAILEKVRKGEEVVITMRGESIAVMKPVHADERPFKPIGFGMWKDRKDMMNVQEYVDFLRRPRYQR